MRNILIIGAGRSTTVLIKYLLEEAKTNQWFITVADAKPELAVKKVNGHPNGRGTWLDVRKPNDRRDLMMRHDVIISLLPAHLHYKIARDCVKFNKYLVTSAYVSRDLYQLNDIVLNAPINFMKEMGLDPAIEHMAALKKIHQIRTNGGKVKSFRSYTGALLTPESDDNPWHYKISWNPRNMILEGQGTVQYLVKGKYKHVPYNRLFKQYRLIDIPNIGQFEAYPNRDSLLHRTAYGLASIPTLKRSTLRHLGFCDAWDALVQLGLTDDGYPILESHKLTFREFIDAYIVDNPYHSGTLKERVAAFLGIGASSEVIKKLEWLGLFERRKIGLERATPAQILEHLIVKRLSLKKGDKDMVVLHQVFQYRQARKTRELKNTLVLKGDNHEDTAMAKLVGLPIGIFVKQIMKGEITKKGIKVPITPAIYEPVLEELKTHGVVFTTTEEEI